MEPEATNIEVPNTQKLTIPANTLQAGDCLRLWGFAKVNNAVNRCKLFELSAKLISTRQPWAP